MFSPSALRAYLVHWLTKQSDCREEGRKGPLCTLTSLVLTTKLVCVLHERRTEDRFGRLALRVKPYLQLSLSLMALGSAACASAVREWVLQAVGPATQHLRWQQGALGPSTPALASKARVQSDKASG